MDFQILTDINNPMGYLDLDQKNQDIRTDIFMSLSTNWGAFFQNTDFGSKLFLIKKITAANILLAKQYTEQALAWLIQAGRATSISVIVEQDGGNRNQLNIKITAQQPDGLIITYDHFQTVV